MGVPTDMVTDFEPIIDKKELGCDLAEEGLYLSLVDFVYHSYLGSRVVQKKRRPGGEGGRARNTVSLVPALHFTPIALQKSVHTPGLRWRDATSRRRRERADQRPLAIRHSSAITATPAPSCLIIHHLLFIYFLFLIFIFISFSHFYFLSLFSILYRPHC